MTRNPLPIVFYLFTAVGLMTLVASCSGAASRAAVSPAAGITSSAEVTPAITWQVPRPAELLIEGIVRHMTIGELVGQMIMVSIEPDGSTGSVTRLGEDARRVIRSVLPGGVILFGANIETVNQVQALVDDLQRESPLPLIVATDHEGGNVSRLTASPLMPATVMPSETLLGIAAANLVSRHETMRALELARGWGNVVGSELRALGITMNLAPVADVDTPNQPGLLAGQRRTFGTDPALVGDLVAATVLGMHAAGVTAVLKHFPGQGAATLDSHTSAISLNHTAERLERVDLVPFVSGINAGARAVMSAHIAYPYVTGSDEPATTSPRLLTGLLRDELGFDGVVITDALNMDAISAGRNDLELAIETIQAGADILLKPVDPVSLHAALVEAANSGIVSRDRLEASVRRILDVKLHAGLLGPAPTRSDPAAAEVLGSPAHLQVVEEIRAAARSGRE